MRQPRHYGGALFCKGAPAEAQRSGFGGESFSAKRPRWGMKRAGKKEAARLAGHKGPGIALPRRVPRRSEMSELSALVGSEGYGACADEGEGGEERGVGGIGERGEGA